MASEEAIRFNEPDDRFLLVDFSLWAKNSQGTAITGQSGSGKLNGIHNSPGRKKGRESPMGPCVHRSAVRPEGLVRRESSVVCLESGRAIETCAELFEEGGNSPRFAAIVLIISTKPGEQPEDRAYKQNIRT